MVIKKTFGGFCFYGIIKLNKNKIKIMINSSLDILYITIAFCILWLTFMFSMLLYYVVASIKRVKDITDMIADKVEKVGQIIDLIKNKVEPGVTQISTIIAGVKKVVEVIHKKTDNKKTSKKKTTKAKAKKSKKK